MNDNVHPINGNTTAPGTVDQQTVNALESLLAMAKSGELVCIIGAGLDARGLSFEYLAGNPGTGISLVGQLEVVRAGIVNKMLHARKILLEYGGDTE
jgi:hypothetical protein